MKIAIACGGTGGHIYPGLAVAKELKNRGCEVNLLLAGKKIEDKITEDYADKIISICSCGVTGKPLSFQTLKSCVLVTRSIFRFLFEFIHDKPDKLLAMGSYSSVGPVIAAKIYNIPVFLHEGNAVPGRAIKFLSRFATKIAVSFDGVEKYFPEQKLVFTGFPIRDNLNKKFTKEEFTKSKFTILVMGGSQGAHTLNEVVTNSICNYPKKENLQVIHLTGERDKNMVKQKYMNASIQALVFPFLKDIGKAYNEADIAICRSGAASCTELAAFGIPAIFIPYPHAIGNHQYHNAKIAEKANAAYVITEADLTKEKIHALLDDIISESDTLHQMKQNMSSLYKGNPSKNIANLILS
ncbi:MAG: undecaprenyldiphospho-muramoylpentapeptide beta-N-acetylglucosaminyltransferase [Kiritimatiellae bacterium]|jgi:UDP-N-acetylglucosamine--N-acetylmuramyl-(pentapeptide) pyrophosphoryl-undecaprenol N-acetylglucosamine transferase|nr:undecaprenyldiphospho-muramoylpentapeptide beta-N-acetylglucosaminyltransferase [Kiritimatiellia bacterium]